MSECEDVSEVVDRRARLLIPPQPMPEIPAGERARGWMETYPLPDLEVAMQEARRCIRCPAAACARACPAHNDIPAALLHLELGDVRGGADVFRSTSNFPEMCGRICPQERLCEGACVLGRRGAPVAIGRLEAFIASSAPPTARPSSPDAATGKRVAIVGSGPAGLAAAEELVSRGHTVTVYDAWPQPGGLLLYGIPAFKLDKGVVRRKLDDLRACGVEFVTNVRIGKDLTVEGLFDRGYHAVFLGHGAGQGMHLGVLGEDLPGVISATEFLVRGNLPPDPLPDAMRAPLDAGQRVVVIGGGDTAMDCARTAVRLGAADVRCVYRRTEDEMPGRAVERLHAKEEGARFQLLTSPVRFEADEDGRVARVICVRMELGEPGADGRRRPVAVPGSEFAIEAGIVVIAVGYESDGLIPCTTPGLTTRPGNYVVVNPETGETDRPGVFAGGDAVHGADLVVTAMVGGRRAAAAIHAYLERAPELAA